MRAGGASARFRAYRNNKEDAAVLEALRKNSKNAIIYVLFGVIIAVFVINFGPGSRGCESTGGRAYAARVDGATVGENEFRYAYVYWINQIERLYGPQPAEVARAQKLKERVMNQLIQRELLAQEAQRMGFDVSDDEVNKLIEDGRFYVLGRLDKTEAFQKDGVFDYQRLQSFCRNRLGVDVATFIEVQKREMLADQLRQLVQGASRVPLDEVKLDYDARSTQVNLQFVRFQPSRFLDEIAPTQAEIETYKKSHEAEIKKTYEERPYLYKKLDKHAHLRRILAAVDKDAKDADVAKAKAKIDEAARRVKAGQPFAEVAKALSDDTHSKNRGGEFGWHKKEFTGLGKILDEKIFAAKPGDVIGPDKDDRGFELVKVEGFREGDLTLEQVASEIAEEQLRTEQAKQRARAEAEKALAAVRAGTPLDKQFPKPEGLDEMDPVKKMSLPPWAQESGPFSRRGDMIPEVGVSPELMKRAFDAKQGDVIGPLEVSAGFVVAVLKERKDPDADFFAKHQTEELQKAEREKAAAIFHDWAQQRCTEARDAGRIKVNDEVLVYEGLPPLKTETKYEPCAKL